ncbi:hypothetical protein VTO73DRAFT_8647 [Trametes versicolor]
MVSQAVVNAFAVVGAVLSLPLALRFLSFIWLYFLRPNMVHRYVHGGYPYAVITGATDGIGRAVASELYTRGFNLILHGRNEKKMEKVRQELLHLRDPSAQGVVKYFIADATKPGHDFEKLLEPFKNLNITLVIHNVGGSGGVQAEKLDERPEEYIHNLVRWNALFPLLLTRVLLPQLRRSAKHGPVLVQFVGSLASDISPPRLSIYAASKRFLEALVRGLDNDEQNFEQPTGVRFTYLAVGPVNSASMPQKPSLNTPTSEQFARAIVRRTGCGRRRVAPYWMHSVSTFVVGGLGERTVDYYTAQEMKTLIDVYAKGE